MGQRVLMLTHSDVPYDNRILKEMEALATAREAWRILAIGVTLDEGNQAAPLPIGTEVETLQLRSRRWTWLPKPLRYGFTMLELMFELVRRGTTWRPDIVHSHDTMVLPAAAFIAWWCRAKLVYDAHELESDKNGSTPLIGWSTRLVERTVWSSVDLFITVSPKILDWYFEAFGPNPAAVVLNSPVEEPAPAGAGHRALRARFGISADATLCVYVGYLGTGRSLESLVEVFGEPSRRAHLVIVGYGELWDFCAQAAVRSPHIHLHEAVPHHQLVGLIRNADVGVCLIENVSLSDYYSLPNKLFEYLAAGLAVLASDFPEMRRVIEKYQCGVVAGEGRAAIRAAIESLEAKRPVRLSGIPEPLSWGAQARALVNAYRSMAT